MRVRITGVKEDKFIQAIKGLRAVEGSSLKAAKWAIDDVRAGKPYEFDTTPAGRDVLVEHGCIVENVPTSSNDDLISALKDFPAGMRVGTWSRCSRRFKGEAMNEKKELGYSSGVTVGVLLGAGVFWLASWYGVLFMLVTMLIFELHGRWTHD